MCLGVLIPPRAVPAIDTLLQTDSESNQSDIKEYKPTPRGAAGPAFHSHLDQSRASDASQSNKSVMRDFAGWDFGGSAAGATASKSETKSEAKPELKPELQPEGVKSEDLSDEEGSRWQQYARLPPDCPLIPLGQSVRSAAARSVAAVAPARGRVQRDSSPKEAETSETNDDWKPPPTVNPDMLLSMPEFV